MTEHVSISQMNRLCVRALPVGDLTTLAEHLAECPGCHQQFIETLRSRRGEAPLKFTLAPEFWFRHEHVDYEQLVSLADNTFDHTEREIIDIHLKICASCKEDVRSFLEFREQIAPEVESDGVPVVREPTRLFPWVTSWRGLTWKPIYAAAVVLMGIALVVGAALLLKRRADNFQAKQAPNPSASPGAPGQTPSPDNHAANSPSPLVKPNESPVENPNSSVATIALNDRTGMVTVDKRGKLSGLDDVPASTRDEIAQVLLSERIDRPAILNDLAGQDSSLRGNSSGQSFKLISPTRTVIVSDRPIFKWQTVLGASVYRVYVNDPSGQEVTRSEGLSAERTEWVSPKPLQRAKIYSWVVVAVVDGKEIVSPGSSSPEMKFQVLSRSSLQELNRLGKTRSHLALGVFYARKGMIAEAEREFLLLVRYNPRSQHAKQLLREIQSWQRR